jgi:hypothetical protein
LVGVRDIVKHRTRLTSVLGIKVNVKIHPINDGQGRLFAFEVGNVLLGRRDLVRIVRAIPGATVLRGPRRLLRSEETFCQFEVDGFAFEAFEPFGSNSRFVIGPDGERKARTADGTRQQMAIERVRDTFAAHWPMRVPLTWLAAIVAAGLWLRMVFG